MRTSMMDGRRSPGDAQPYRPILLSLSR
jgi:hypothetical protein